MRRQLGQIFLTLAFLPYDAFISLDAIGRTLLRLLVTHKRLLEWQTSSDSERTTRADLAGFYATMWIAPVVALATGLFLAATQPAQLSLALPMLGLWLAAPWIAWSISQPIESATPDLTAEQLTFLRRTARKTWHFFETFVTAQENWLPPDNFQEVPAPTIASRTSPTNIGLALLANLAARDLGYLSAGGLIQRTQDTFATMQRLERHRGHFYNWYETRTLRPLLPLYISSVDSGNLAGHLLTLGSGLREQAEEKIFTPQVFAGLRDTVGVLRIWPLQTPCWQSSTRNWRRRRPVCARRLPCWKQRRVRRRKSPLRWRTKRKNSRDGPKLCSAIARSIWRNCFSSRRGWLCQFQTLAVSLRRNWPNSTRRTPCARSRISSNRCVLWLKEKAPAPLNSRAACVKPATMPASACSRLESLAAQSDEMAAMDFTFLFDPARDLFSTGFNVTERRCDTSFYDLLASEARLCSYVAIALGQVPQDAMVLDGPSARRVAGRADARFVERLDVRISDAAAGHAQL